MVIDGKTLSQKIFAELKQKTQLKKIKLVIILANDDESSRKYTELKKTAGETIGVEVEIIRFDNSISKDDLIKKIQSLNSDSSVNGIVVQLPLFKHLESSTKEVLDSITSVKDADGLTSYSLATAFNYSAKAVMPAAVEAVLAALREVAPLESLKGKKVLIINNSNLVGNPLAIVLSKYNATVTIANEYTDQLKQLTKSADIIVTATGVTNIISANDIQEGAVLIDVTSISKDGKVYGDFIFDDELKAKASAFTPVPGGIGPLTVASLFKNLLNLVEQNG